MDKIKIKQYLLDFQERKFPKIIPRDILLKQSGKIYSIIGARRVGKTYLLFKKIRELLESGIERERIIYLNFESPLLNDINYKEIREILELQFELFPEIIDEKLFLFVDEPQEIEKWELAIRDLHDSFNAQIFITGSSSKLLSKEIATALRGRALPIVVPSLSFKEFLRFKNVEFDVNKLSSKTKSVINNKLEEYLNFGGYPEVALAEENEEKLKILKSYFDLVVYKDLVERYRIKNITIIKWLIKYLISSVTKEVSVNKVFLNLKSQGIKVSKNTLYDYLSILEDSFFISLVRKFNDSLKKEGLSIPKIYLNDVGFLNLFSERDVGKRMENIVFNHLLMEKEKTPLKEIFYWKSSENKEVDFLIKERGKTVSAMQVSYSLNDVNTYEREVNSLISCLNLFSLKKGTIITKDMEGKKSIKGFTIEFVPLFKWLLK
jgi:predicted AAA+ superfamily ATPase